MSTEDVAEVQPGSVESPAETAGLDDGIEREIDHDEFDPIGTVILIGMYMLILIIMWTLMYFVEFLGHGPSIIG